MGMFSKKTTLELGVSGMTCGNCEAKVTRALLEIRGVKKVVASSSESRITVMVKGVSENKITEVIRSSGFVVNP